MRSSSSGESNKNNYDNADKFMELQCDFASEKEFYGFHPARLMDDIINAAIDYGCDCIDEIEEVLLKNNKIRKIKNHKEFVAKGCDEVQESLIEGLDRNFDKFEHYSLKNVLKFPDGTDLLPDLEIDEAAPEKQQEEDEEKLAQEIELIQKKIAAARLFKEKLAEEEEALQSQLDQYTQYRQQYEMVASSYAQEQVTLEQCVKTVVAFERGIKLQTKEMQSALVELENKENCVIDPLNSLVTKFHQSQQSMLGSKVDDVLVMSNLITSHTS